MARTKRVPIRGGLRGAVDRELTGKGPLSTHEIAVALVGEDHPRLDEVRRKVRGFLMRATSPSGERDPSWRGVFRRCETDEVKVRVSDERYFKKVGNRRECPRTWYAFADESENKRNAEIPPSFSLGILLVAEDAAFRLQSGVKDILANRGIAELKSAKANSENNPADQRAARDALELFHDAFVTGNAAFYFAILRDGGNTNLSRAYEDSLRNGGMMRELRISLYQTIMQSGVPLHGRDRVLMLHFDEHFGQSTSGSARRAQEFSYFKPKWGARRPHVGEPWCVRSEDSPLVQMADILTGASRALFDGTGAYLGTAFLEAVLSRDDVIAGAHGLQTAMEGAFGKDRVTYWPRIPGPLSERLLSRPYLNDVRINLWKVNPYKDAEAYAEKRRETVRDPAMMGSGYWRPGRNISVARSSLSEEVHVPGLRLYRAAALTDRLLVAETGNWEATGGAFVGAWRDKGGGTFSYVGDIESSPASGVILRVSDSSRTFDTNTVEEAQLLLEAVGSSMQRVPYGQVAIKDLSPGGE